MSKQENFENSRILVVDDDLDLLGSLARYLRTQDLQVAVASDYRSAVNHLELQSFNLVLTDLKMEGETGIDLCRYVRTNYPETPVVLISGMASAANVVEAVQGGAATFLEKPIEPQALIDIIQTHARSPKSSSVQDSIPSGSTDLNAKVRDYERFLIEQALSAAGGSVKSAMEALGLNRRTLNEKMRRLGIRRDQDNGGS